MAGVNKVVYGGDTLIDLTSDTVIAGALRRGYTAHDKSGAKISGSMAEQAAQTITPGTDDKSIPSGRYLTGAQTIKGDANLVAGNIKKGVSIFGVTGTMEEGATVFSGTGKPSSSLGGNGDIYVKTK